MCPFFVSRIYSLEVGSTLSTVVRLVEEDLYSITRVADARNHEHRARNGDRGDGRDSCIHDGA